MQERYTNLDWDKFAIFRPVSLSILQIVQDRPMVAMERYFEAIGSRSIRVGSDDLE